MKWFLRKGPKEAKEPIRSLIKSSLYTVYYDELFLFELLAIYALYDCIY